MKTLHKLMFGCLALMVALSMAFVSCSDDDDDDGGKGPVAIATGNIAITASDTVSASMASSLTDPQGTGVIASDAVTVTGGSINTTITGVTKNEGGSNLIAMSFADGKLSVAVYGLPEEDPASATFTVQGTVGTGKTITENAKIVVTVTNTTEDDGVLKGSVTVVLTGAKVAIAYTYDLDDGTSGIIVVTTAQGDSATAGTWEAHLKNTEVSATDITMAKGTYTGNPTIVTGEEEDSNKVVFATTKVVKDYDAIREGHTPAANDGDLVDSATSNIGITITEGEGDDAGTLFIDSKAGSVAGDDEGTSWKALIAAIYKKINDAGGVPSEHVAMLKVNTGIDGLNDAKSGEFEWPGIQIHNLDAGGIARKVLGKGMSDLVAKNGNGGAKITFRMDGTTVYVYGKLKNVGTAWTEFGGSNNTGHFVPMLFSMLGTDSVTAMHAYILDDANKVQSGPGSKAMSLVKNNSDIVDPEGTEFDAFKNANGLYADALIVRLENLMAEGASAITKTMKIKFSKDVISDTTNAQTGFVTFNFSNCTME